jgi:hypothetical protein
MVVRSIHGHAPTTAPAERADVLKISAANPILPTVPRAVRT